MTPTRMLKIACDEGRKKLDDQLSAVDSIDQKTGILIGFAGLVLTLLPSKTPDAFLPFCIHFVAQSFLVMSLVVLFFGFRSVRLKTGLNLKGFSDLMLALASDDNIDGLLGTQLAYLRDSVDSNNKLISYKNTRLAYGSVFLLAGLLAFVISSIV
jgi:hypothetical protein